MFDKSGLKQEGETMAIITISRQTGSLGDEVARAAAEALEYEYIEKIQISEILAKLGFSPSDMDKFDEKKPSVWQSLIMHKELFTHYIRAVVYELASRNNVVIVGRGGQAILKDVPGTLHVRIIAPYATRVKRSMEQKGYEEKHIERLVRQGDRDSSGYLSTYFDMDWDDSALYDLVINTRVMDLNKSVELITCAVDNTELEEGKDVRELLYDQALNHRAKATLLKVTGGTEWADLEVENGIATLSGLVRSPDVKNDCEKALLGIEDITIVNNHLGVRSANKSVF